MTIALLLECLAVDVHRPVSWVGTGIGDRREATVREQPGLRQPLRLPSGPCCSSIASCRSSSAQTAWGAFRMVTRAVECTPALLVGKTTTVAETTCFSFKYATAPRTRLCFLTASASACWSEKPEL